MRIGWRLMPAIIAVFAAAIADTTEASAPRPLLADIFLDHAVLQRDRPIQVWGEAAAADRVTVSIAANTISTPADASGRWRTALPAMPAGGPYVLSVRTQSGASQAVSDVLVGDVWLCSGQSNMELPVSRSLNAAREISGAANDSIRILSVAHASSPTPLQHFQTPVSWQAAQPNNIADFSAACYYFARELQKSVPVPLGLIHSSFGGSSIEPWLSEAGLRALGGYDERLDLLRLYAQDPQAGMQGFANLWERWWRSRAPAGSSPWKMEAADSIEWHDVPLPMRDWKTWGVAELKNHDGMVWFRRSLNLSAAQAAGTAALSLGAIDEVDETWVNGRAVGNSFGWGTERTYQLPAGLLHAGENLIVVNVLSTWDAAGMYGPPEHMALRCADGSSVALGGQWRYQFVADSMGYPPRSPWESIGGLSSLHNAMIAPLEPYGLRGVLWYQGESNVGNAAQYQQLLAGLKDDWRRKFSSALPFLIVELPNFGAPAVAPLASDWASLREAQRRAAADDPLAALVVTIDIGDRQELHPPNKQELGRRLARAARHLVYGERISASGPTAAAARREQDRIIVTFANVEDTLVAYSATAPVGFELCGPAQASCRFVNAKLQPAAVVLDAGDATTATRVRFCWGDAPVCNLYDRSGLPAGPFELQIQ